MSQDKVVNFVSDFRMVASVVNPLKIEVNVACSELYVLE